MTAGLDEVLAQALVAHDDGDPVAQAWEVLCVETIRMARAHAAFDDARRRYVAARAAQDAGGAS